LRRLLVFFASGVFSSDGEGSVGGVKVSDLRDSGWDSDDRSLQAFGVFVPAAGQYSLIIDGAAWAAVEFGAERLQDKVTSVVLTRATYG
jgi:hypothetical protein